MKNKLIYIIIAILLHLTLSCKNQKDSKINASILTQKDTVTISDSLVNSENIIPNNMENVCDKCKIEFVKEVKINIDNLTEEQAYNFLCCIDESCTNNVEFTEFSNEMLYLLLYKKPELALRILSMNSNISLEYIKKQLENPVNDKIDVNNVYKNIENVGNYESVKKELLSSIKLAIEKYN